MRKLWPWFKVLIILASPMVVVLFLRTTNLTVFVGTSSDANSFIRNSSEISVKPLQTIDIVKQEQKPSQNEGIQVEVITSEPVADKDEKGPEIKGVKKEYANNEDVNIYVDDDGDDDVLEQTEDAFIAVPNQKYLYLRSAYRDFRFHPPRMWVLAALGSILDMNSSRCIYELESGETESVDINRGNIKVKYNGGSKECFYRQMILYCEIGQRKVHRVSLTFYGKKPTVWMHPRTIYDEPDREDYPHDLGICVQKLFDMQDNMIPNIVAFIEMQRLLGITQLYLYDIYNSSPNYQHIINYYEKQGYLKFIPWKLEGVRGQSEAENRNMTAKKVKLGKGRKWRSCASLIYGQALMYTDCAFRNMNNFKYFTSYDPDEFIIPQQHDNLSVMLHHLEDGIDYSTFIFRERHFCPDMQNKSDLVVSTSRRVDARISGHAKYIARTKRIGRAGVHSVHWATSGRYRTVPYDVSSVHHYRLPSRCDNLAGYIGKTSNGTLTDDYSVTKYFSALSERLKTAAKDLQNVLPSNVTAKILDSTRHLKLQ